MATIAQLDVVLGLKGDAAFKRKLAASTALVGGAALAFDKLITRGGKIAPVMAAFTKRTGDQATALAKLRAVTGGLVSDFELMQQANMAFTLGSAETIDQFAEMAEVAQKLGRSLGVDAAFALNSLNTGIARQSKLLLDNLGIIVKVREGEDFRTAAMRAALAATAELGEETRTAADEYKAFKVELGNVTDGFATMLAQSAPIQSFFEGSIKNVRILTYEYGKLVEANAAYSRQRERQLSGDFSDLIETSAAGGNEDPAEVMRRFRAQAEEMRAELEEIREANRLVIPSLGNVAHGIHAINDGQSEFLTLGPDAITVFDVYALSAGNAADEVDRLAQAQNALRSGLGFLGGIGRMFGFGIPGLGMLSGAAGALSGGGGLLNIFGGGKAAGGPVEAGRAYLVGEQGPELMVPSSSGTIVPNGGLSVNVTMSAPRSSIEMHRDQEWLRELRRSLSTLSERGMSFA